MKLLYFGTLLMAFTVLFSCSSDQSNVNKVEGDWELVDRMVFINDELQPPDTIFNSATITYTFKNCDLASSDYCEGSVELDANTGISSSPMVYRFEDGGNTIVVDYDADAATTDDQIVGEVTKLADGELVFEYSVTIVDETRTVFALQKQ